MAGSLRMSAGEVSQHWDDLNLSTLLNDVDHEEDEKLIDLSVSLGSQCRSPTSKTKKTKEVIIKKFAKTWTKPSHNVLKDRYDSVPHKPPVLLPSSLARLADPLMGRYKSEDDYKGRILAETSPLDSNGSPNNNNNNENSFNYNSRSPPRGRKSTSLEEAARTGTGTGGFFLTAGDEPTSPVKTVRNNNKQSSVAGVMVADKTEMGRLLQSKDPLMGGTGPGRANGGKGGSVNRLRRTVNTNNSSNATRIERNRLTGAANRGTRGGAGAGVGSNKRSLDASVLGASTAADKPRQSYRQQGISADRVAGGNKRSGIRSSGYGGGGNGGRGNTYAGKSNNNNNNTSNANANANTSMSQSGSTRARRGGTGSRGTDPSTSIRGNSRGSSSKPPVVDAAASRRKAGEERRAKAAAEREEKRSSRGRSADPNAQKDKDGSRRGRRTEKGNFRGSQSRSLSRSRAKDALALKRVGGRSGSSVSNTPGGPGGAARGGQGQTQVGGGIGSTGVSGRSDRVRGTGGLQRSLSATSAREKSRGVGGGLAAVRERRSGGASSAGNLGIRPAGTGTIGVAGGKEKEKEREKEKVTSISRGSAGTGMARIPEVKGGRNRAQRAGQGTGTEDREKKAPVSTPSKEEAKEEKDSRERSPSVTTSAVTKSPGGVQIIREKAASSSSSSSSIKGGGSGSYYYRPTSDVLKSLEIVQEREAARAASHKVHIDNAHANPISSAAVGAAVSTASASGNNATNMGRNGGLNIRKTSSNSNSNSNTSMSATGTSSTSTNKGINTGTGAHVNVPAKKFGTKSGAGSGAEEGEG